MTSRSWLVLAFTGLFACPGDDASPRPQATDGTDSTSNATADSSSTIGDTNSPPDSTSATTLADSTTGDDPPPEPGIWAEYFDGYHDLVRGSSTPPTWRTRPARRGSRTRSTATRLASPRRSSCSRSLARRPRESQLAAVVSPQSRVIESLGALERERQVLAERLGDGPVPRPERWGGHGLVPEVVELWRSGASRMHERRRFVRSEGGWSVEMLGP